MAVIVCKEGEIAPSSEPPAAREAGELAEEVEDEDVDVVTVDDEEGALSERVREGRTLVLVGYGEQNGHDEQ